MLKLHLNILREPQRSLWDILQQHAALIGSCDFRLAGGTALALQIGHRESHDFDFFSRQPGIETIRTWLESLPSFVLRESATDTVHGDIAGVKVSFIAAYRSPFIAPAVPAGALMMADITDIALMKMLAITHRAALRDYIDLAAILRDHCLLSILMEKSMQKFGANFNSMLVLRTLVHFGDLDGEMPVLLDPTLASSWQEILLKAVKASV